MARDADRRRQHLRDHDGSRSRQRPSQPPATDAPFQAAVHPRQPQGLEIRGHNAYRVRRLDPPTAPPLSVDEQVEMAFRTIVDDVPFNFWFRMMVGYLKPDTVKGPEVTSNFGGMPTQQALRGRVDLEDDEVFRVDHGLEALRLLGDDALRLVADERRLLEPHQQPQQRPGRRQRRHPHARRTRSRIPASTTGSTPRACITRCSCSAGSCSRAGRGGKSSRTGQRGREAG